MLTLKTLTLKTLSLKTLTLKMPTLQTLNKMNKTHSRNRNKVEILVLLILLLVAMKKQAKEPVKVKQAQKIVSFLFKKTKNMKNFIDVFLMKRMNSNLYEVFYIIKLNISYKLNIS